MRLTDRFYEYARAFEKTYVDDDWQRLGAFFTEDATYVVEGLPAFSIDARGREAVLSAMRGSVEGFDRRFDSRSPALTGELVEKGDTVTVEWASTYSLAGAPDLRIAGTEIATYQGDRIRALVDRYTEEAAENVDRWLAENAKKLR